MAKQSQHDIDQMIRRAQPTNRDLVRRDILQALQSPSASLLLKVVPYYYPDGTLRDLLCLSGTVACQYRGNRYNIPIEIWFQQDHPDVPPLAYVRPTSYMYISTKTRDVQPDGTVVLPYLEQWCHPNSDMSNLINAMSEAFSRSPPVYSRNSIQPEIQQPNWKSTSTSTEYMSTCSLPLWLNNDHEKGKKGSVPSDAGNLMRNRYSDMGDLPAQALLPIRGYNREPLKTLEQAIRTVEHLVDDITTNITVAKVNVRNRLGALSMDEAAAIQLYTMETISSDRSLYYQLNQCLRSVNRGALVPWFPYLHLLMTALYKLPSVQCTVWRGIKDVNLSDEYQINEHYTWWHFSSCTESVTILDTSQFLGKHGVRTLFTIECKNGKKIKQYSYLHAEEEILLLPGTYLKVVGKLNPAPGLHIIHVQEADPPYPLISPPF